MFKGRKSGTAGRLGWERGFTLVDLLIVVLIVGVLGTLALYGVRRYVANAKTAEARNALGRLARDASAAYNRERMEGEVLDEYDASGAANRLCPSVATPVPNDVTLIRGKKYQSSPVEWSNDPGWTCLMFQMRDPQYYQYMYESTPASGGYADGHSFKATAGGDIDGDGILSLFELKGRLQTGSDGSLELTISPNLEVFNPDE